MTAMVLPVLADRTLVRVETNFGDMVISLLTDDAPDTVENFLDYVETDFYDGLIFHRVVNDPNPFVIQAGAFDPNLYDPNPGNDPNFFLNPNWTKDPNFFHTPNAPVDSEADNGFSNIRGTVAMALSGGDADSGTSQFFISLTDNSFLDAQDFTVFGEVIVGMEPNGIVDTIGAVATQTIGDGVFKLTDVPDANTPVIIQNVTIERVFESDSGTFTNVDFLNAADGELRTYVGQGNFSGKRYTHSFAEEKFLGVQSLRWTQTAVPTFDVPAFDIVLAKDEDGIFWVLDYQIDGQSVVDANSLLEAVTMSQLSQEDMLFKLIVGEFNDVFVNDINNSITINDGGNTLTEKIVGLSESLMAFPDFDNELIQVRSAFEPFPFRADWRWNHESLGLVLELVGNTPDANNIDVDDDGWRFLIPDVLTNLEVSFKAGKNRTTPTDSFRLTGDFDFTLQELEGRTLFLFMGPFEEALEINDFKRSKQDTVLTYKGRVDTVGKLTMKINLNKSEFTLRGKKINLTGVEQPVRFEMAVGNLFSAGEAVIRKGKPLPMSFRQGVTNSVRIDKFRYVSDNFSGVFRSRSMKIKGAIATSVNPFDPRGKEITVNWGAADMTIDAEDPNLPSWTQKGSRQKYIYRSKTGDIRRAAFDLDRAKFSITMRRSGLASPVGAGQDFSIQFDFTEDDDFDEMVEDVAAGTLPKLSGD